MQWILTIASGASSLGGLRLTVHPRGRFHRALGRGKSGENSPHLLGNIKKGKSKKQFSRLGRVSPHTIDMQCTYVARFY
jgi:hypothetical protein